MTGFAIGPFGSLFEAGSGARKSRQESLMLRNTSTLRKITFSAIAAIALGAATLSTPVLARGGGGGGGGHGGGGGGHMGGGFGGGHMGGGFGGGHFGGGGMGHFGGGFASGIGGGHFAGSRGALRSGHVGRVGQGNRRVRFGRGYSGYDDGYGYDDCYSPWSTGWQPYCY
jgi:hypothetical protein